MELVEYSVSICKFKLIIQSSNLSKLLIITILTVILLVAI